MNNNKNPSTPVLIMGSALYWLVSGINMIVTGIVVVITGIFSSKLSLIVSKFWSSTNLWALNFFCKLDYEVKGIENIGEQNAIVLCKHQSTWETIALHNIIPYGRWVYKRELLMIPFFGWALASTDPISINRGAGRAAVKQLITKGTKKLRQGKWIIMFPEGTRKRPGPSENYKIGGALLAADSGYPVLPIAHNAGEFWPKGQFIKMPGTIKVRVGPLIEAKGRDAKEILEETKTWIENTTKEISDPRFYS